ncbi:MAG: hypothetical protein R8K49_02670 [Mariprofundaceae bacterium]
MSIKKIAIVGLGQVGGELMEHLMRHQELGLEISCVSELNDTQAKKRAVEAGIATVDIAGITAMGEEIDIIFDLTGSVAVRSALREGLFASGNKYTVIVAENVSHIIWSLLTGQPVPDTGHSCGY